MDSLRELRRADMDRSNSLDQYLFQLERTRSMSIFRAMAGLSLLLAVGCDGGSASKFEGHLEPVTGTVIINEAPYAGVEVTFLPEQGTPGTGASALTNEKGEFQLQHRSGKPGVEAGTYRVLFSLMVKADGTPLAPGEDAATLGNQKLPPRYQNFEQTPEKTTVPSGGGTFEYKLKAK